LSRVGGAREEIVASADGRPQDILPISHFARRFTTRGTPRRALNTSFSTVRNAAEPRFSFAPRRTAPLSSFRRGCSIALSAHA
jgi:hypothetical protein